MTQTALSRLLKYPHAAVFDGSPVAELAFRLQHADGATWSIGDRSFSAKAGSFEVSYDLRNLTVGGLRHQLSLNGFEILSASSRFTDMSALVLIEGSGDQNVSNGDHISGFTSLLWVILGGFAGEVLDADDQVKQALIQMVITTASGEWLDLWGSIYGVARRQTETDAHYSARIPQEAFRARNNAHAIELAILDATGYDVRINEPWREIFTLDESELSGSDKMYDGERVGYHLIEPVMRSIVDWPAVLAVINRNRAAGIGVLGPRLIYGVYVDASSGQSVESCVTSSHLRQSVLDDRALLDYGPLEDVSILNHEAVIRREIMHTSGSTVPVQSWSGFTWGAGSSWADTTYIVQSLHFRDYRVYYSAVAFEGQFWDVARRTWAADPQVSWADLNVIIGSSHTRSS